MAFVVAQEMDRSAIGLQDGSGASFRHEGMTVNLEQFELINSEAAAAVRPHVFVGHKVAGQAGPILRQGDGMELLELCVLELGQHA